MWRASWPWQSSSCQAVRPPRTITTSTPTTSSSRTPSAQPGAWVAVGHTCCACCHSHSPGTAVSTREIGIRFHPTRGAMSLGESKGGLPPDSCCEDEAACLADMRRCVEEFHDNSRCVLRVLAGRMPPQLQRADSGAWQRRYSMLRVSLAPCAPFNVTTDLMEAAAKLARKYPGVRLHTHLAENQEDVDYCIATYGCRPGQYIKCALLPGPPATVFPSQLAEPHTCASCAGTWGGRAAMSGLRTAACWTPQSASSLRTIASASRTAPHPTCAWRQVFAESVRWETCCRWRFDREHMPCTAGIAPVRTLLDSGVNVGIGVDGTSSNDSGHLLAEVRLALFLQRASGKVEGELAC